MPDAPGAEDSGEPDLASDNAVTVELGAGVVGKRIDRSLADALDAAGHPISRTQLHRCFDNGEVLVKGRPVKRSYKLDAPTAISIVLPAPAALAAAFPEDLGLDVIFEDEHLLVVNKAPGMVCHASLGHDRGTLVNGVLFHLGVEADGLPLAEGNPATRPGLVHRLDKDTSGAMVVAKSMPVLRALSEDFSTHDIDRRYRCFVRGVPNFETMRVDTGHARDPADRRRFAPVRGAKRRATTHFVCVRRWKKAGELTAELETGRTHQIRMHARHLGIPILGDLLYGREARDPKVRAASAMMSRQALHAELLGFTHPVGGERVRFEAELPVDMQALREALGEPA